MRVLFLFRILAIVICLKANVFAAVFIDYQGFFSKDNNLPGIPSKNFEQYKQELKAWARILNVSLEQEAINNYINSSLYIGFEEDVKVLIDGITNEKHIR